jgi:MYXO-CTERM domain-containing protein
VKCDAARSQLNVNDKFVANCAPYTCRADACLGSCTSITDCATGYVCIAGGICTPAPATSAAGVPAGCCATTPGNDSAIGLAAAIAGALVIALRRRKPRQPITARG